MAVGAHSGRRFVLKAGAGLTRAGRSGAGRVGRILAGSAIGRSNGTLSTVGCAGLTHISSALSNSEVAGGTGCQTLAVEEIGSGWTAAAAEQALTEEAGLTGAGTGLAGALAGVEPAGTVGQTVAAGVGGVEEQQRSVGALGAGRGVPAAETGLGTVETGFGRGCGRRVHGGGTTRQAKTVVEVHAANRRRNTGWTGLNIT